MKKIYKIIASISVFLIVLFVGVVLVIGNTNKKANAGVIIQKMFTIDANQYELLPASGSQNWKAIQIENLQYAGILYSSFNNYNFLVKEDQSNNTTLTGPTIYTLLLTDFTGSDFGPRIGIDFAKNVSSYPNITKTYFPCEFYTINNDTYLMIDFSNLKNKINIQNATICKGLEQRMTGDFYTTYNNIAPCNNIYDLENKSFCLLYLSDISGIATAQMRDEITINWGFIDSSDNTIYSEYAPTISAQNLAVDDDTLIRLGVPLNNSGSAMDYYDISQKALLSTIDSSQGGATATAHIYGIYIWRNQNMIEWGLAEFDTTSTPTSGATMNYLTSTTRLYQYQNVGTFTMTCRLSVSSNFNFITIKNQEQVDVSSVNAVIRQGGFMPAWALYNWARGSHSGFTSGEQYGSAQYQQGQPGYNAIYQAGRQAGLNENIGTQNWFIKIFEGVDSFLSIRIFPNITFGVLLGIPFIISVVWFIIRSFRGGGGS